MLTCLNSHMNSLSLDDMNYSKDIFWIIRENTGARYGQMSSFNNICYRFILMQSWCQHCHNIIRSPYSESNARYLSIGYPIGAKGHYVRWTPRLVWTLPIAPHVKKVRRGKWILKRRSSRSTCTISVAGLLIKDKTKTVLLSVAELRYLLVLDV